MRKKFGALLMGTMLLQQLALPTVHAIEKEEITYDDIHILEEIFEAEELFPEEAISFDFDTAIFDMTEVDDDIAAAWAEIKSTESEFLDDAELSDPDALDSVDVLSIASEDLPSTTSMQNSDKLATTQLFEMEAEIPDPAPIASSLAALPSKELTPQVPSLKEVEANKAALSALTTTITSAETLIATTFVAPNGDKYYEHEMWINTAENMLLADAIADAKEVVRVGYAPDYTQASAFLNAAINRFSAAKQPGAITDELVSLTALLTDAWTMLNSAIVGADAYKNENTVSVEAAAELEQTILMIEEAVTQLVADADEISKLETAIETFIAAVETGTQKMDNTALAKTIAQTSINAIAMVRDGNEIENLLDILIKARESLTATSQVQEKIVSSLEDASTVADDEHITANKKELIKALTRAGEAIAGAADDLNGAYTYEVYSMRTAPQQTLARITERAYEDLTIREITLAIAELEAVGQSASQLGSVIPNRAELMRLIEIASKYMDNATLIVLSRTTEYVPFIKEAYAYAQTVVSSADAELEEIAVAANELMVAIEILENEVDSIDGDLEELVEIANAELAAVAITDDPLQVDSVWVPEVYANILNNAIMQSTRYINDVLNVEVYGYQWETKAVKEKTSEMEDLLTMAIKIFRASKRASVVATDADINEMQMILNTIPTYIVSEDGTDVPTTLEWVSTDVHAALTRAILDAQNIAPTRYEVAATITNLILAHEKCEATKSPGKMAIDSKALQTLMTNISADIVATAVSVDGTDIPITGKWVKQSDYDAIKEALANTAVAETAMEEIANIAKIAYEITKLTKATTAFDAAKQLGTWVATKSDLDTAITEAETNLTATSESEDGFDVTKDKMWVTTEVSGAYTTTIEDAKATASTIAETSKVEISDAIVKLMTATKIFDAAKQPGAREVTAEDLAELVEEANEKYIMTAVSLDGTEISAEKYWASEAAKAELKLAIERAEAYVGDKMVVEYNMLTEAIAEFDTVKKKGVASKEILLEEIGEARANVNMTKESANGEDVATDKYWTTAAIRGMLNTAIASAETAAEAENAGPDYIAESIVNIRAAVANFEANKKAGTLVVDKALLDEYIAVVLENIESVNVSTDGSDVKIYELWVSEAAKEALNEAIVVAEIFSKSITSITETDKILEAQKELSAANDVFNEAKADGKAAVTKETLVEFIAEMEALADEIWVSEDGSDVASDSKWANEEVMLTFNVAIVYAENEADELADDATAGEVVGHINVLKEARDVFKAELEYGKAGVTKETLQKLIDVAKVAVNEILVSVDGGEVPVEENWVTEEERMSLNVAIAEAQKVIDEAGVEEEGVSIAIANLKTAQREFDLAKKPGRYVLASKTLFAQEIAVTKLKLETTALAANGEDVLTTEYYVSASSAEQLRDTLDEALVLLYKEGASTIEVNAMLAKLRSANEAFDVAKRGGEKLPDLAAAEAIMSKAEYALDVTIEASEAQEVKVFATWASAVAHTVLNTAMLKAQEDLEDEEADVAEIATELNESLATFNASKSYGLKAVGAVDLAQLIADVKANQVAVSVDGSEILRTERWVKEEVAEMLGAELSAAVNVVNAEDAEDIEVASIMLSAVAQVYYDSRAWGTAKPGGEALLEVVSSATAYMNATKESNSGSDIYTYEKWVTASEKNVLKTAISVATEVLEDVSSTAEDLAIAAADLTEALNKFKVAAEYGKKMVDELTLAQMIEDVNVNMNATIEAVNGATTYVYQNWATPAAKASLENVIEAAYEVVSADSIAEACDVADKVAWAARKAGDVADREALTAGVDEAYNVADNMAWAASEEYDVADEEAWAASEDMMWLIMWHVQLAMQDMMWLIMWHWQRMRMMWLMKCMQ
ncbi:hypothetical protein [Candidatus Epulonipiscium viviparus]|uniref:hypothetical protein n=1 Tax=Candidatus Epulonipiscium viviparus TaxID=420336 RepID=UPI00273809CE|nr:hypothetical protein [Candidatus Epulopiscium viviparus]